MEKENQTIDEEIIACRSKKEIRDAIELFLSASIIPGIFLLALLLVTWIH